MMTTACEGGSIKVIGTGVYACYVVQVNPGMAPVMKVCWYHTDTNGQMCVR